MVIGTGITYLPFGAVKFRRLPLPSVCGTESTWCQTVEQGDTFKAQIQMGEMTDVITNGDFQDTDPMNGWSGSGWAVVTTGTNNRLQHQTGAFYSLVQAGVLSVGTIYKCTFTISDRTAGTLNSQNLFAISANGVYTHYFRAISTSAFFLPSLDFDGSIDDISCVEIEIEDDITAVVLDSNDAVVYTFPGTAINQFENHLRIEQTWANIGVPDGCYTVAITDNNILIDDQFNDNSAGWGLETNLSITGGNLRFAPAGVEARLATLSGVLDIGATYTVEINITAINASHSVQVQLGTQTGAVYSTVGVKTESITANGADLILRFRNTNALALSVDTLTYITIQKTSIDAVSECFELRTTWECSKLFKWQNTGEWGGYNYETWVDGTRFEHRLRHIVNFKGGSFPRETNFRETSDGINNLDYARMRRNFQMGVSRAKSYIHDAIAAFFSHDTSTIDDVDYVSEDDYDTTPGITDMQTGKIEIGLKNQNLTNIKL